MLNVYLDPSSYRYLSNNLFDENNKYLGDDFFAAFRYLKTYCWEKDINLNTVDFWSDEKSCKSDVYLTIDHKGLFRRLYWHFIKNKKYPTVSLEKFSRKILFQFEPPLIMPDVYSKINRVLEKYDKAYFYDSANFTHKSKNLKCGDLLMYQSYDKEFEEYWKNSDRKFLAIISSNKSPRPIKKVLAQICCGFNPIYLGYKELLSKRIEIIDFFGKNDEIDVYGNGWEKLPLVKKYYKGSVEDRLKKLSEYKFAITFENSAVPGFITERIFDAFYAGTIPIYLGAPNIEKYIPKNCFVDMRDFKNCEELRSFLKSLSDSDIEIYRKNIQNFFKSGKFRPFSKECLAEKIVNAIQQ